MTTHREGAAYDADETFELPPLTEVLGAGPADPEPTDRATPLGEGASSTLRLGATYFDTADLRLAAAGLTLWRRTGGADAGWHLTAVDGSGEENVVPVGLPAGRSAQVVPARLRAMVHARSGGEPLAPVARIDTVRTVRRVVDGDGQVVLEVADDSVSARRLLAESPEQGDGAVKTWRVLEVLGGDADLVTAVDRALRAHGLTSATRSGLARVLAGGGRGTGRPRSSAKKDSKAGKNKVAKGDKRARAGLDRHSAASDVVLAYVSTQVEQVRANDLQVRLDADGGIHAMRVATRRLRSALSIFDTLFDASVVGPLIQELKWLAGVLGRARDAEVMRDRVTEAVATEREEDLLAPTVVADVGAQVAGGYERAKEAVLGDLDGERYRALLSALERLVSGPPLASRGARPAEKVLPKLLGRSLQTVGRAMKAADGADGEARLELLHDARKAAKRTRYAAEAVRPAFGSRADALAAAMESVQEALGHHLDTIATRDRVRELASSTADPRMAFTYGRLHALADARARRSETDVDAAWGATRKKAQHSWLD